MDINLHLKGNKENGEGRKETGGAARPPERKTASGMSARTHTSAHTRC